MVSNGKHGFLDNSLIKLFYSFEFLTDLSYPESFSTVKWMGRFTQWTTATSWL